MSNENKKSSTQPIKTEQKKVENQKSETKGAATAPIKAKKKAPIKPTSEDEDVKVYNSDAGKTRIRKAEPKTKKMPVVQKSKEEKAPAKVKEEKIPIYIEAPKREKKKYGNSSFSAAIKTISYIVIVLIISVVLAVNIILVGNDIFALNKSDNPVTVTIGEFPDIGVIADALEEKGVIKYSGMFKFYAALRHKDAYNFASGTYTVSPDMNYDDLIIAFVPDIMAREQISITIPEGYSVDEIIDLFVENGIGTRDGFIDVINNYEFDYWFLEDLECSEDRIYRLEGYLYPDTYYFWSDSSEEAAIEKLLANFKNKFRKSWLKRCEELGMTMDEVLILASMIQEEAKYPEDYAGVSSVFHNRLNSSSFNGLLQSDVTIQYYYRNVYGSVKIPFTDADKAFDCPYNTYMYRGLIPSPLSTPTIDAINAAMYPAKTDYYYFVTDAEGYCMFAKTYNEHRQNVLDIEDGKGAKDDDEDSGV